MRRNSLPSDRSADGRLRRRLSCYPALASCPADAAHDRLGGRPDQRRRATSRSSSTPSRLEAVQRVSGYFNALKQMKGVFVQTDPDKKRTRGRFYVQKPGKFRFDYSAPSRKIMASDGRLLRIKEPDQANEDAVELDNTPFRLLLKANVDLLRDARILDVQESEDLIVVALQDRSPDAPGRVQLIFVKKPGLELKEWVVRDPQGLETKVEVGDINKTDAVDPKLFVWEQRILQEPLTRTAD